MEKQTLTEEYIKAAQSAADDYAHAMVAGVEEFDRYFSESTLPAKSVNKKKDHSSDLEDFRKLALFHLGVGPEPE